MPALSSSSISAALEELSRLPAVCARRCRASAPGLAEYLAWVPDPRNRRGVRHSLTSLLMAAVAAVLAGATRFHRHLETAGHTSIAAACRHHARDVWPALA